MNKLSMDRTDPRTPRARSLRRAMTRSERLLWAALRRQQWPRGHFRRQVPIGPYFADFAHHGLRLVIEVDGGSHAEPAGLAHDARRTAYLEAQGYKVMRFWNGDVALDCQGVVETILAATDQIAASSPPYSSPISASPDSQRDEVNARLRS